MDWEMVNAIFNNASMAAFLGAFFAFLLVLLTDIRRKHRKKRLISKQIEANYRMAHDKIIAVTRDSELLSKENEVNPAPIIRFPIDEIVHLKLEVLDLLEPEEKLALDAACFLMHGIDDLLEQALGHIKSLKKLVDSKASAGEKIKEIESIKENYKDALANLRHFKEVASNYIAERYDEILSKQYVRDDYEGS